MMSTLDIFDEKKIHFRLICVFFEQSLTRNSALLLLRVFFLDLVLMCVCSHVKNIEVCSLLTVTSQPIRIIC